MRGPRWVAWAGRAMRGKWIWRCGLGLWLAAMALVAQARPLVLISVDGLRPDDLHGTAQPRAELPHLRRLAGEGSTAQRVRGVMPTLTYPSHATLLTGVSPARHGIASNLTFDPEFKNQVGWYWYAADFKVDTLWDAARQHGLRTASVHWPVSVGAAVDANLPQIWRTGTADDRKLLAALATPGLLPELEAALGPYPDGIDESVEADERRARFAARLFERQRPDFMTVYFAGLDHEEHRHGAGSPQALDALRRLDAAIGELIASLRRTDPQTVVALVSDHGFVPLHTDVNLFGAFIQAGLISVDEKRQVSGWKATLWPAAGSAAVVLRDPADQAVRQQVQTLLAQLAGDPANGIDRILDAQDIVRLGGAQADHLVLFKPGFQIGRDPAAPMLADSSYRGMHGYSPESREMDAVFVVTGPGIPRRDLGGIDMRDIAPTLARLMRVELPQAEGQDLLP
ncbi:ectonucleotide pyrophosphatase/phosphodiesterase [Pseudoxanthomonas putridarboris]|uniref:Ectonucleotide pyrophosphatase/phosphodiesterase n=1 Tax=Pseudoxanthomonas putridarboris TaxID=752605 RepID=A0ABU9J142_9GAMM